MKKIAFILSIIAISSLLITMFIPIIGPVVSAIIAIIALIMSIIALSEVKDSKHHAAKEIISITLSSLAIIFAVVILLVQIIFNFDIMMYNNNYGGTMTPYNEVKTHERGMFNNYYY